MEAWKKRNEEKRLIIEMVGIYCRAQKHGYAKGELCDECAELLEYSVRRIDRCSHIEDMSCANCPTQCYSPEMRGRMKQVMRCAGPRMLLSKPHLALKHAMGSKAKGKGVRT